MSGLYLYLSGNYEFSGSAVWSISSLNCYQFPSPTAILCFYIVTFPNHYLLSQSFETQWRPGRLKQKPFPSKDRGTGAYIAVSLSQCHCVNYPLHVLKHCKPQYFLKYELPRIEKVKEKIKPRNIPKKRYNLRL